MVGKYLNHKWILYQEIANESNLDPEQETNKAVTGLLEMKLKTDDSETNKHVHLLLKQKMDMMLKLERMIVIQQIVNTTQCLLI